MSSHSMSGKSCLVCLFNIVLMPLSFMKLLAVLQFEDECDMTWQSVHAVEFK